MDVGQVSKTIMIIAVLLSITVFVVLFLNPFKTIPVVNVIDAYWTLDSTGYKLVVTINATDKVQLLGVEVNGKYYSVVYDIYPPQTRAIIHTDSVSKTVKLHFDVGSPKDITVRNEIPKKMIVKAVTGNNKLFLYGVAPNPSTVSVIPVNSMTRVLVVTPPGSGYNYKGYVKRFFPDFNGVILDGYELRNETVLYNYTTIIFADIAPEPDLLSRLIKAGKNVVLYSWMQQLGTIRMRFSDNGTLIVNKYDPDKGDIEYFGAHCIVNAYTRIYDANNPFLNSLIKLHGKSGMNVYYGVVPSEYCSKQFLEVYATTRDGDIVFGLSKKGFYFASMEMKDLLMMAMSGFFDGKASQIEILDIHPFRGVYPLNIDIKQGRKYMVSVYSSESVETSPVEVPPITYNKYHGFATLSIGIAKDKKNIWNGTAKLRIVEATYSGDVINVTLSGTVHLPTNIEIRINPLHVYLVYVNETLMSIIADEDILGNRPSILIEYSSVYEFFYISVKRYDSIQSPLIIRINGKDVAILDEKNTEYFTSHGSTGYYRVTVHDCYGRVVTENSFLVRHVYEQPLFIASVISAVAVFTTAYAVMRRRALKEVESVKLILYRLPDVEEKTITEYTVATAIDKLAVTRKISPRVPDVLEYVYKKHSVMKSIVDATTALMSLIKKRGERKYTLYSRYIPELDDTITIISPPTRDPLWDFYAHVLIEVAKKFGASWVPREDVIDIFDVDYVLVAGKNMILITFAPRGTDVKQAIDRVLTSFVTKRRLKIPYNLIGAVVITEPKYVSTINRIIDRILDGDKELASKIFRDTTVATRLIENPKSSLLSHFIIVAAPITRIAPLIAFTKLRAVRICNKYYRLAPFTEE